MIDHLFIIGYPGDRRGQHRTVAHGQAVAAVRAGRHPGAHLAGRRRLAGPAGAVGCRTVLCRPDELPRVPGLAGSVVVSMCNTKFLAVADRFGPLGCRTVWVGCMNWLFPQERLHYRRCGPFDRHVFQSRYQRDQLVPQLRRYGYQDHQGRIIRGAMDAEEFRLPAAAARGGRGAGRRPHQPGRARQVLAQPVADVRADPASDPGPGAGLEDAVEARTGPPPPGPSALPPGRCRPRPFLKRCTCWSSPTPRRWRTGRGWAWRPWPPACPGGRGQGGWQEMLRHGQTGYLCRTDDEMAYYAARLAYDEAPPAAAGPPARREALTAELADPHVLWPQWQELFESLEHGREVP